MNTLGDVTTNVFEHTPEAHKLHISFDVQASQAVHKGDSVVLHTDGTVRAAVAGEPKQNIIGVSLHSGTGNANDRVTVAMKGYAVVIGEAAAASFNAGPCKLGNWNATTVRREFAAQTITAIDNSAVDGTYGLEEAAVIANLRTKLEEYQVQVGWNLTQATADGDVVKVCLL